ncbi:rolling circle replication-associated protein [Metabacillus sp. SLBN-84]
MYRKVIVTGDIIEVYEMEKAPHNPHENCSDKHDSYSEHLADTSLYRYNPETRENAAQAMKEWTKNKLKEKVDRKEERRKQTLRDAKNTARRIALNNFDSSSLFVTLTYAENMTDIGQADKDFAQFVQLLNEDFDKKHKYFAVREFQDRGAIHYHMLIDLDITWDRDDKERREYFERLVHDIYWHHGWVDLKRLDYYEEGRKKRKMYNPEGTVDNVGAYIVKYMDIDDGRLKGHKAYLTSAGLERPKVYTGIEAEAVIAAYELDTKKETFTNSYESEYLGKIVYKEHNPKRKINKELILDKIS